MFGGGGGVGTTSACAENTDPAGGDEKPAGNYLRVRGEYMQKRMQSGETLELPPRARRILKGLQKRLKKIRTTSACAENTCGLW